MDDQKKASVNLKDAEKSASADIAKQPEDSVDGALEEEEKARGFYSAKGLTGKSGEKEKGSDKVKKILKRRGPIGIIFGMLMGVGGMMMGFQTMLPVAIEEMLIEKLNSIGTSSVIASDYWLDTQLNLGVRESQLHQGEYKSEEIFGISEWQVQSLENQGFEFYSIDYLGRKWTVLLGEDDINNVWIPAVGSELLEHVNYNEDEFLELLKVDCGRDNVTPPVSAKDALANNRFRVAYTTASKTWRGGNSGWFDNIMEQVTEIRLSINRNRWARYAAGAIKGADKGFKKLAKRASGDLDDGIESKGLEDSDDFMWEEETPTGDYQKDGEGNYIIDDETGEMIPEYEYLPDEINDMDFVDDQGNVTTEHLSNETLTENTTKSKAQTILKSKAFKAASMAAAGGSILCSVAEGIMSIYTVATAYKTAGELNHITAFLESVDKMKAGKGTESPYHEEAERFTAKSDTVSQVTGEKVEGREGMTAMDSAGMSYLFNNTPINNDDPSVKNNNISAVLTEATNFAGKMVSGVAMTAKTFEMCGYVKVASAGISAVTTVLSIIPGVGQGIKLGQLVVKGLQKVAITAAVATALNFIVPYVTGSIVNYIVKDVATEWLGEDLGNVTMLAGAKLLGENGKSGGQSPGGGEALLAYLSEHEAVVAQEAEYQRAIRSPFDITSPYTFLGSMVYSLIPAAFSGGGMLSTLRQVSTLTASSLASLIPTASAITKEQVLSSKGDCPLLEGLGIVGDAYCNPYIITDVSTIKTSPVAVNEFMLHGSGEIAAASPDANVGGDLNPDGSIKEDSDLAKYVTYCGQRTSPYGMRDGNIANDVIGGGGTASSIIGYASLTSDAQTIIDGLQEEANMKWISGSACVASSENEDWVEYRWYQRYEENMRLAENMNPGYKSAVTNFIEKHNAENPVDNSFEGILARFSGMSKEKVEDTLALMDYIEYVNEYDASERYAFVDAQPERPISDWFDNENVLAENHYVLTNQIIYADVRNRQTMTI